MPGYGPPPAYVTSGPNIRIDPVLNIALAPWWKRLIAILIDGVILNLTSFIVFLVIAAALANHDTVTTNNQPATPGSVLAASFGLMLLGSIPGLIYYPILNGSRRGQTVGKIALGIAVRDARTGGSIGFWRALGRDLITVVFRILLFIPYIFDSLAPLWDGRRQAWHDKVVHSVVVDLKP
jgi:uncharacterized RDD family membrane protein YckC